MTGTPLSIRSRDNPSLVLVRRAMRDPGAYRRDGALLWLEGDHLLRACLARGHALQRVLVAESAWSQPALRSLVEQPLAAPMRGDVPTVLLDRLQDAGNVGSILRSAAALGVPQVLALKGTAALWSPKVLRAGMGAHFALQLHEGLTLDALQSLSQPWVATSSHAPTLLHHCILPQPCAWVFGHEGQGVAPELAAHCAMTLRIAQPGGEESLNVAAAAAICLHESVRQRG
jgi:TrmH family RNA methyltransferase